MICAPLGKAAAAKTAPAENGANAAMAAAGQGRKGQAAAAGKENSFHIIIDICQKQLYNQIITFSARPDGLHGRFPPALPTRRFFQ